MTMVVDSLIPLEPGSCSFGQGCGVGVGGVACFQLESESVFKTAGV